MEPGKNIPVQVLQERFPNTYKLCNNNDEKFTLLLQKGVYSYEYMITWKRFNEKYCYSELNMEGISNDDTDHVKNVFNTFKIPNLGKYHDLYVKSDVALLADVFENFRNKCLDINKLDPACYLSAPGLCWHSCLKKNRSKIGIINKC